MSIEMIPTPLSSHVWEIGYDEEQRILRVRYAPTVATPGGRVVEYIGVESEVADQVVPKRARALHEARGGSETVVDSVGSALHQFVRGRYPTRG